MHLLNYENVPLGILIVALASLLFATGATIQHLVASKMVDPSSGQHSMSLKQLLRLITTPKWLLGLSIITVGALAHIVALTMAPVTVVQPVGILAVPWSVLMAAKIHGHKVTRPMWIGVAFTIIGITGFTLFSARSAAKETLIEPMVIILGCVVVYAIGASFGLLGWKGRSAAMRSMMWATGGSFFYGLSSALIKTVETMLGQGELTSHFWIIVPFLVGSYAIGGAMIQQGYATGPAEIVVGSMTTTDPIVGVSFGILILGEGALISPAFALGMAVFGAVAIYGVVVLSKYHPDAIERRNAERAAAAAT